MEMELDKQTREKAKIRPDNLDPTGRLPGFARPVSYKLVIAIVESHFEGTCTIGIDILSPTDSIVLHADGIEIFSTAVEFEDDEEKTIDCKVKHYQQYAELRFGEVIEPGRIFITMDYAGLYDHLNQVGFCYKNYSEGLSQFWTRFEPTYARRAFPCFDEPHFKAVFSISIETNANCFVYSNTDVENETLYSINDQRAIKNNTKVERKLVEFAVTPPLSTAYVGWFITTRVFTAKATFKCKVRFEFIGYVNYKGKEEIIENVRCIERVFNYIYYYFGLRLEMYCLRYIEIPAMAEVSLSWGLGFFPATYISSQVQPSDKSWMDKKQFFMLKMAPHVAKLWIGIYSTVQFWNEVWLQEGITHFVKFAFANSLNLSLMHEALERREAAIFYDGMVDARALAFKVEDSNYVEDCFDEVILNKGFIVVRLLWLLAAEDIFSLTLKNLLNRRKFKNFTSAEFIEFFRNMTSPKFKPALDDFHKWIDQAGVPQILLAVYDRNINEGHRTRCKFEQSRFYHIPRYVNPYIKPEFSFYLDYKELMPQKSWNLYIDWTRIHIEILNHYKRNYFANISWNGYHLTKQHKNSLKVLHWCYDNGYLSTESTYNLVNDAIFMAFANQEGYNVSMSYLFKFLLLSRKHSKFLIWRVVDAAFQKMDDVLIHAKQHVRDNFKLAVYRIMVSCRPPECLTLSRNMFNLFIGRLFKIDEKETIRRVSESPNLANTITMPLRQIVRKLIVHNYAEKIQPIIMQHPEFRRERNKHDVAVVEQYIYTLSQEDLRPTIEKIEYVLCHEYYRSSYYIPLIKSISDTVDGQKYLSNFIHQNYKVVWENLGAREFKKIFPYFVNMAVTEEDAIRVENLFEKQFTPEMQQVMRYTVQEIAETIRLNKRIFDSTSVFFEKELHDPYYEKVVAIRVAAGCAPDGTGGTDPHPDVITIKYRHL